jgi:hypothetical protein
MGVGVSNGGGGSRSKNAATSIGSPFARTSCGAMNPTGAAASGIDGVSRSVRTDSAGKQ